MAGLTRRGWPAAGLLLAGALLAACSSGSAGPAPSSTLSPSPAPSTTLAPLKVAGTEESGSLSFLGGVYRLAVTPLPTGAESAAPAVPGTPAYAKTVEIAYRQLGSGKPLVLIPGEGATMDWWSVPLLAQLAAHYRVTLFDLPGVGYSGPAASPLTIDLLGDLTAGLIAQLKIAAPVVLGWGLGGQVALALAERHPSLAEDLVLVDTGVPTRGSRPVDKQAASLLASSPFDPYRLASLLFTAREAAAKSAWLSSLARQVPDTVTAAAAAAQWRLEKSFWAHTDVVAHLSAVKQPTLVVEGTKDVVFPPRDATALAAGLDGSQRYSWNGVGYGGMVAEPSHFAQLLEGFTG